jgi:hypothetical protein
MFGFSSAGKVLGSSRTLGDDGELQHNCKVKQRKMAAVNIRLLWAGNIVDYLFGVVSCANRDDKIFQIQVRKGSDIASFSRVTIIFCRSTVRSTYASH